MEKLSTIHVGFDDSSKRVWKYRETLFAICVFNYVPELFVYTLAKLRDVLTCWHCIRKAFLSRISQVYYWRLFSQKHINIKIKLKQKLITRVMNLIKLGGLGGLITKVIFVLWDVEWYSAERHYVKCNFDSWNVKNTAFW